MFNSQNSVLQNYPGGHHGIASISMQLISVLLSALLLFSCSYGDSQSVTRPLTSADVGQVQPSAEKRVFEVVAPSGSRMDEYYWLRDDKREDQKMLAYLTAENAYADAVMAPLADYKNQLYEELIGKLKQDDVSVPYLYKDYWYYSRFEEGKEYQIYARRRISMDAPEEIMLDVNELAKGHSYYQVGNFKVSPNQQLLAFVEDSVGRRQYSLRIKNLETGAITNTGVTGLSTGIAWAGDNATIFYTWNDPDTLLSKSIKSHKINGDVATDPVVYHEPDDSFYMDVGLTRSEAYICIYLESTLSTEQRCANANNPGEFKLIAGRTRDFEYKADHLAGRWVVRTNWNAQNFKLMTFTDGIWNDRSRWVDLVPHDEAILISGFELFDNFVAIAERSGGLTRIRILSNSGKETLVAADEPAYCMALDINPQPNTDWLRYSYTSLTTPATTYELNMATKERRLLKESPVLGGFDKSNYVTERQWAIAHDGTRIPVSIVYRKGFVKDGRSALLQYGYGSYGNSVEPTFSSNIISLLDRGMVYAIAHIRGGQEMGRQWYEEGKLLKKKNTFTDFIDVTNYLVEQGYAAPDRVAALGGSAGGLLMGAIANMAPSSYRVIVSQVPFVDIVTTMLDESIPLTTNEFDEWGNPKDPVYYEYMLSYSPYDQSHATSYPAMFVGTGLWDSQVQYWEPAKYVARLRDRQFGNNLLVFRTKMEAGHGGSSGRFQRYRDIAEYYTFMMNQLGVTTGR
ncbi:MAG: S9 family peptidase [Syntrophales bacterium]|jgi:oligopeptidase B|nr:S9 family peptidase [Syntrophales bacterium]